MRLSVRPPCIAWPLDRFLRPSLWPTETLIAAGSQIGWFSHIYFDRP